MNNVALASLLAVLGTLPAMACADVELLVSRAVSSLAYSSSHSALPYVPS